MLSCASKEIKTKNYFEYFSDCAQFTLYESHPCFIHHLYHAHSQHQKRSIWQNQKCQNCPKNYLQFMAHQRRNMRRHRLRFCVSYFLSILSDFLITREIDTKMTSQKPEQFAKHQFLDDRIQCWTEGRRSTAVAENLRPTAMATVAEVWGRRSYL